MSISFNVDEIFEMAEQIEQNGAGFYREAARKTGDKTTQKMFMNLASMEDGHLKIFQDMRKQLDASDKEPTTFDPDDQAALYLQAMADSHGIEGKKDRQTKLTGSETIREILEIAVNAEKNSIVFYTALRDIVSAAGRDMVDSIIAEELGHLAVLKTQLVSYLNVD
jgi:rubrerythrin